MKAWLAVVPAVFAVMNIAGFALMGADKRRAKRGEFRVPEAVLFAVAFFFGGVGCTAGMFVFRHKTKHLSFRILLPLFALISVAAAAARNISCGRRSAPDGRVLRAFFRSLFRDCH